MRQSHKTLIVIDVQRDFFDPSGALYVNGGELLPNRIAAIANRYGTVIFTMDWHPGNHCSFRENDGPWPSHCVQYTQGAGLADEFSRILASDNTHIVFKGMNPDKEQYGAFEEPDDKIISILKKSSSVEVCGIAGDYCVKETVRNLIKYIPAARIVVLKDLVRSIDGGAAINAFIKETGCREKPAAKKP